MPYRMFASGPSIGGPGDASADPDGGSSDDFDGMLDDDEDEWVPAETIEELRRWNEDQARNLATGSRR